MREGVGAEGLAGLRAGAWKMGSSGWSQEWGENQDQRQGRA